MTGTGVLPRATGARRRAGAVVRITRTEVRRFVQDRVALFSLVILPMLIVLLIGSAFGAAPREFVVGVVDADRSAASAALVAALEDADTLVVAEYDDERLLRRDIRLSQVSAGVLVPRGYAVDLEAGRSVVLPVVTVQADESAAAVVATVRGAVAQEGAVLAAGAFVAETLSAPPDQALAAARAVQPSVEVPDVVTASVGTVRPEDENAFTRAVYSQLVLFMFLNGVIAAAALVETRRLGIGRRAMAAPVGSGTLVLGLGGSRFSLGLIQAAILLGAGALVFGVSFGDPGAIAALVVAFALVAAGAGMLLGAVARTADQAIAIAIPLGIGLAMLGGTMWPLEAVGSAMRTAGQLTPHAWAMDAWTAVVNDGAGLADISSELAVLVGCAAGLLAAATVALRRTLTR